MEMWLSRSGAAGADLLRGALARGATGSIRLPGGILPMREMELDRRIELVGDPASRLSGTLRIEPHGKARLRGLTIAGNVVVRGQGLVHLLDTRVEGTISLARGARALIEGGTLQAAPGGPALLAEAGAEAWLDMCRIFGGAVIAVLDPRSDVRFNRTVLEGLVVYLDGTRETVPLFEENRSRRGGNVDSMMSS